MSEPTRIFIDVPDDGSAFTVGLEDGEVKALTVLGPDEVFNFAVMVTTAVTDYFRKRANAAKGVDEGVDDGAG